MKIPVMDEKHRYILDGKRILSVTQVLVKSGIIKTDFFSDYACECGSKIHEAINLYDIDDLYEPALRHDVVPYLDQWKKFKNESGFVVLESEQVVYSKKYGYIGTYDKVGLLNDRPILLDFKSGASHAWHGLQLAAYRQALIECDGPKCRRFTLVSDGEKYKLHEHKSSDDFSKFAAALKQIRGSDANITGKSDSVSERDPDDTIEADQRYF